MATSSEESSPHIKQCPEVASPHSSKDCNESVPRQALKKHSLVSSSTHVDCPHCNHRTTRKKMEYHKSQMCPKRPFICPKCKCKGHYYHITGVHLLEECPKVQIPCPNASCTAQIPREDLPAHLATCPKQQVECPLKWIGCRVHVHRGGIEAHKYEHMVRHLDLAMLKIADIQSNRAARSNDLLQGSIEVLEGKVASVSQLLESQVSKLEARIEQVVSTTQKVEEELRELTKTTAKEQQVMRQMTQSLEETISDIAVPVVPTVYKMTGFEEKRRNSEHWHSPPFYTQAGGYKMCLRVYPNGTDSGYGTHTSLFAVLMKGKNDENLIFPFCGSVTFGILNQLEDSDHAMKTVLFDESNHPTANGRVTKHTTSDRGMGYGQFISHAKLKPRKRTAYLLNDSLYLTVVSVTIDSANKPWLIPTNL